MQTTIKNTPILMSFVYRKSPCLSATHRADQKVFLQIPIDAHLTSSVLNARGFLHRVL